MLRAVYPEDPRARPRGRYIHYDYGVSGDFRWQRAAQPAPAELVLGPAARPPELFSRLFRREPWWEPVPAGLVLYPRAQLVRIPPGPSRLVAVHPGWRYWQPPRAVH